MINKGIGVIEIQNMDRVIYELYWVKPGIDNQRCINTMRNGNYFKVADHTFYLKKMIDLSIRSKSYLYLSSMDDKFIIVKKSKTHYNIPLRTDINYFVGHLSYKDNPNNAKKFINELGNPYSIILLDRDGTKAIEWGAFGVPETFLIYENKIVKRYIGPLNQKIINEIGNYVK